jgi:hypothetical protein
MFYKKDTDKEKIDNVTYHSKVFFWEDLVVVTNGEKNYFVEYELISSIVCKIYQSLSSMCCGLSMIQLILLKT